MPSEQPAKPTLGRLEKIDLAVYWETEAADFTPWLAQENNINLLGETIGMKLEVVLDKAQVEDLQSYLLCRDIATQSWVIIGNQLNPADDSHLGRLLIYAADINATADSGCVAIVWVASQFSAEHRTALDWLNQITQSKIKFFGLELELWRIGESAMAAHFNLVTQPKSSTLNPPLSLPVESSDESVAALPEELPVEEPIEELPIEEPLTEIQQQNLDFWTALCDRLEKRGSIVKSGSPVKEERISFAIGRSGFRLYANIDRENTRLYTGLHFSDEDAHAYFSLLQEQQNLIDALGLTLTWDNYSSDLTCSVYATFTEANLDELEHWPKYVLWFCDCLERFHTTFSDPIKRLNAFDFKPLANSGFNPFHNSLILPS
jgi:Domain of unknown function (DUF4268)